MSDTTVDKIKDMMKYTKEGIEAERARCLAVIQQPTKFSIPKERLRKLREEVEDMEERNGWEKAYEIFIMSIVIEYKMILARSILDGQTVEDIEELSEQTKDTEGWYHLDDDEITKI